MDSNLSLIKALANTLLTEIDSIGGISNEVFLRDANFDLNEKVKEFEIRLIKTALIKTRGNQRRAATLLGIKPTTLYNKIKTLDIKYLKMIAE